MAAAEGDLFRQFENFLIWFEKLDLGTPGVFGLRNLFGDQRLQNQYVCAHFKLLGPLRGRAMSDFIFVSGLGTIVWGENSFGDFVF